MEERYLTPTALTKYIKYKFDNDVNLETVLLEGEISNFKHHSRGHFYFTLKDDNAQISCTMFSRSASAVKFDPKDGMKVFVKGRATVYEKGGNYQLNVFNMKSDGIGDLYLEFIKLKETLEKKGFFLTSHKKAIPRFPKTIGVVTAETGAAVHDIINTTARRYPLCTVILYPSLVQGIYAKDSIVEEIEKANNDKLCDVLIVGRGGGSIEDLWCFNEECVATAIYNSEIPIISAVGHEVDFTISDFVADMRAATPTAAAELATPNIDSLKEYLIKDQELMTQRIKKYFENKKLIVANLDRTLDGKNPIKILEEKSERVSYLRNNLDVYIKNVLINKRHYFDMNRQKLHDLSPLTIMEKGYSISKNGEHIIKSVKDVKKDDIITVSLVDGNIKAKVEELNGKDI